MRFESFHYIGLASTGYEHGLYIHTSYFIYPRTFKVALTANVTEPFQQHNSTIGKDRRKLHALLFAMSLWVL